MYATVRRYEGIDKVRDSLLPSLHELPGFGGSAETFFQGGLS